MRTDESTPRLRLASAGTTHIGLVRKYNEDSVLVRPELGLFAVADGAGGHNAGNLASTLAVSTLANYFERTERATLEKPEVDAYGILTGARRIVAGVQQANREIREIAAGAQKRSGMGSTVVALSFSRRSRLAHLAHLGDSRCYRLRGGYLDQLTEDHCFRQDILEVRPDISDEELRTLPLHTVTRGLGLESTVRVAVRSFETAPGDSFLLCSDGLSSCVTRDHLRDLLAWPAAVEARVQALVAAANQAGGRDNIGVVVVSCDSLPDVAYEEAPTTIAKRGGSLFPPPSPRAASSAELAGPPLGNLPGGERR
jgi:protein phosphatase